MSEMKPVKCILQIIFKKRNAVNATQKFRMRFFYSIHFRFLCFLFAILAPIFIIQILIDQAWVENQREAEYQTSLEVAHGIAETFSQFVDNVLAQEYSIGLAFATSGPIPENQRSIFLEKTNQQYAIIRDIGWVSPQGRILYSSVSRSIGEDISHRSYFKNIRFGQDWSVSELIVSFISGKPVFIISRGIRDDDDNLLGMVAAVVEPEKLNIIFPKKRKEDREILLIDSRGRGVFRNSGAEWTWKQRNLLGSHPRIRPLLNGNGKNGTKADFVETENQTHAFTNIPHIGWIAGASISRAESITPVNTHLKQHAAFFLLVLLLALSAVYLFTFYSIIRPLQSLQQFAWNLRRRNFDARISPAGSREFKDLGNALNSMTEELAHWMAEAENEHRRLRAVIDALPVGVFIAENDKRKIDINDRFKAIWGGQPPIPTTLIDYNIFKGRWAYTGEPIRAEDWAWARALENGETTVGEVIDIERFDGRQATILNSAAPILDAGGKITGFVSVMEDITHQRELAKKTAEQAAMLQTIFDTVPVGIVMAKAETEEITFSCRETDRLLGGPVTGTAAAPEPCSYDLLKPDGSPFLSDELPLPRSLRNGERLSEVEMRIQRADGSECMVSVNSAPVRDIAGRIQGAVATLTDITERKRMEEELRRARHQLEKQVKERTRELLESNLALQEYTRKLEFRNRELEEFAHIAAHDLREPLRKVQVFTSLLMHGSTSVLNETDRDYFNRLVKSVQRMDAMVKDLLHYSQVIRHAVSYQNIDLNTLIQEVLDNLEVQIKESGVKVDSEALPEIEGNPAQIRQLFQNLIQNAIKYRREDNPRIRIAASEIQKGICRIAVEDNGIGFDESYADKIFQPFQRLHGKQEEYDGTGIGLAICRKVVEHHGGTITATSSPGEGSAFFITLPASRVRPYHK